MRMSLIVEKKVFKWFLFGNFGLSGFWCNEQSERFFTSIFLYKCFALNWVLDGGIRICSGWRIQVWNLSEMDKNYTFRKFRTVGTLMQGLHIDNSAIEKFSITRKLSMLTLMGEIKRVVLVKDKFEYREKLKCFRWKFRTIRILMKGRKTITFSLITRLQVLCVRLWSW